MNFVKWPNLYLFHYFHFNFSSKSDEFIFDQAFQNYSKKVCCCSLGGRSVTDQYSKGSLFRLVFYTERFSFQKNFYSEQSFTDMLVYGSSLYKVIFIPKGHYSEVFLFQKWLFQMVYFSEQSLFWNVIFFKILNIKTLLFWNKYLVE